MSVEITNVRYGSTPKTHETIVAYKWRNPSDGVTGESDKASMIRFLDVDKGEAYVGNGADRVPVGVWRPDSGNAYLRTYSDGKWTNNLTSLDEF